MKMCVGAVTGLRIYGGCILYLEWLSICTVTPSVMGYVHVGKLNVPQFYCCRHVEPKARTYRRGYCWLQCDERRGEKKKGSLYVVPWFMSFTIKKKKKLAITILPNAKFVRSYLALSTVQNMLRPRMLI